ncbi:hypothetical protein BKA60DRAFT_643578 [Fusarium oxysporum]|nr:hypothetical protein BKA60DRAFT_643578 [Fusarium oxysporum]
MKICEEVLQKLSQDPTLKATISLLALVVTHFWPWDYVRCHRQYTMARVNPSGVNFTVPTLVLSNWKEKSLEAIRSEPALRACQLSDDGAVIALLMTFAPPGCSSLEIFQRGASLRRRWTRDGHVKDHEASDYFIHPKVKDLLLDETRVGDALKSYQSTQFCLGSHAAFADQFRHKLPADVKLFWSYTAMVLTCGAIPWKSLTPVKIDYYALNRCLHHTVAGFTGNVDQLPDHVRLEIASSLVEASRLPYPELRLKWRKFAIDKAEEMTQGLPHCHRLHIAQARSQLKRLQGDYEAAHKVLNTHSQESDVEPTAPSAIRNFADGLIAIQRCLNCLQRDEISTAIDSLRAWVPGPTPMAAAVMFQSILLLAKCLRFRGQFLESQTQLTKLRKVEDKNPDLDFEEYRRDWAYESAASLIEQVFPEEEAEHRLLKAEHRLHEELNRMKSKRITYPKDVPLRLLLAECFFAQEKYAKAEEICHNLTCELKFDRLHRQIILAKINHAKLLATTSTDCLVPDECRSLRDKALAHWMEAGKLITSTSQNEGHSSLVVYLSLMNLFSHCEDTASQEARKSTGRSIERAQLGQSDQGVKYWIPGLMSWKKKLSLAEPLIDQRSKL